MITELGHFALALTLAFTAIQMTLPLIGASRGDIRLMELARYTAISQFLLVATAFFALMHAYVVSDFSVLNVAENSHSLKPMLYKISGTWANHEGSLLLWILILAFFGALVALFGRNLPPTLRARVLAVQAMIGFGFVLFILFTSNPFARLWPPPADGRGLNPLLQDPGLAFHPPFLYLGYVGFSISFAFAVAALIEGKVDAAWARWVRPWTLAAWAALTLGIAMGSWWAYYELGWGGFWFWDPVENASLMPWLAGTALLHSAIVVEKRDALKSWTILLAILTFSLSLIGTFLVRSGVLTSVHAFASDPTRGVFILALLVIAVGGSLTLYAVRAPVLKSTGVFAPVSREGALILNNLLLATATGTVFLGTLYPLFLDAIGGGKVSVGPPFFNATILPLMAPVAIATAFGPMLAWKRGDLPGVVGRLRFALAAAALVAAGVLFFADRRTLVAAVGLGVATWLFVGVLIEWAERVKLARVPFAEIWRRAVRVPRATYGMSLAHSGLAIVIAGITASGVWQTEVIRAMQPGEAANLAGYDVRFDTIGERQGPNYRAVRATLTVTEHGSPVAVLTPERRTFSVEKQTTTEAAIHTTWFADIYAAIGDTDDGKTWTVRLYHNPLVPWIWIGCLVMVFGGCLSLSDRRHRVGAPQRRRASSGPVMLPAE